MTDENRTPDTPTSGSDEAEAAERAIRLSKPEEAETATEPTPSHSALEVSDPAPSVAQVGLVDPIPEHQKALGDPTPSHSELETAEPAPSLSDPLNRDKEATGEMAAVKPVKTPKAKSKSAKKSPDVSPPATLEDDPPMIINVVPAESTTAPEPNIDHGTMTPIPTPSASEIVANAKKKAADIVEDRVNMSGSVRQAKNARYEAIQETKQANAAFEKAADEVGSVTDKLEGSLGVMDFLLDKELNDFMDAPPAEGSRTTSASAAPSPSPSSTTSSAVPASNVSSAPQEPEWKRKASELYEQKRQQEQAMLERRRAQTQATMEQRSASDDQLKAGREALEARLKEERAASEARMKSEREAIEAKRRAEQERLRTERAAMDARLKEEREAREAERRASKKLGRDD